MTPTQTAERDAYSIQELADCYGVNRMTIYREIWDGRLTVFKMRGRTLASRDAVDAWRNGMQPSKQVRSVGASVGGKAKKGK